MDAEAEREAGFARFLQMTDDEVERAPVSDANVSGVPVVDISELMKADTPTIDTPGVQEIAAACREWGFFQVRHHGIEESMCEELVRMSDAFFKLPAEVKKRIKRGADNPKGFFDDEFTKRKVDWKECFDYGMCKGVFDGGRDGLDGENQWLPEDEADTAAIKGFHEFMEAWLKATRHVASKLLSAMTLGLGIADHALLHGEFAEDSTFTRLNYYPVCPENDGKWSIMHHTDAGAVTVLHQSKVNSLQVFNLRDLKWYPVPPQEGCLVINTGDIMQVWSNDVYKAPLHRVRAQQHLERFSTPTFFNPSFDTVYKPVAGVGGAARYNPIVWREFRTKRAAGDFADLGTEVQIYHFRTEAAGNAPPAA
eukprot:TRINITY_DN11258_c0_g1_i2.p1 TRINITY_DN11258_c0_g1~~TRINITY_DN11258_c0_g1_i2.p1  ORF type:complete len:366 (+),score=161.69 TRINITY_DN11258_c0_g1_i2:51-1148(+)